MPSMGNRKLSRQQLFNKCFRLENFLKPYLPRRFKEMKFGVFSDGLDENIRFQPWVLAHLLRDCEEKLAFLGKTKECQVIELERKKMERAITRKPEILLKRVVNKSKQSEKPKISVISPSLNHGRFLEETIKTIANQSYQNFEHIVIDGDSTDETVSVLKRYSHLKWVSEKDSGPDEALRKGLAMARGKYIMPCCVSDGYLDRNWFKRCVEILDFQPEVSLVWGFPQNLSEDGVLGKIFYPQFHLTPAPQKADFFYYWLRTRFGFPEGNFCVRKEVIQRCLEGAHVYEKGYDTWLEFNYNFESLGYLSYHVPVVANFGRAHHDQRGLTEQQSGQSKRMLNYYFRKVADYRRQLVLGAKIHVFRDSEGKILPIKFSVTRFCRECVQDWIIRINAQVARIL